MDAAPIYQAVAELDYQLGNVDEAVAYSFRALHLYVKEGNPDNMDQNRVYQFLGERYLEQGKMEAVEDACKNMLNIVNH